MSDIRPTQGKRGNNLIPRKNLRIILFLTIVSCTLLTGLTLYGVMNNQQSLLNSILSFVQYYLIIILAVVGGRTAANYWKH
jgi:hypothetical protein